MRSRELFVEGMALWAPGLPDWATAAAVLRGECSAQAPASRVPAAQWLSGGERRRAPESVALALEVARMAVAMSGRQASELLGVFTSAHGDLPLIDALCTTLAEDPLQLSPTKFLHSIHNVPAGLWSMVAGGPQASTTLTAFDASFAAGLLEAAVQCAAEQQPVLLVGCDTAAAGALMETAPNRSALAVALVLAPERSTRSSHRLTWSLGGPADLPSQPGSAAAQALARTNPGMAQALPLFESLAALACARVTLAQSHQPNLQLAVEPLPGSAATFTGKAMPCEKQPPHQRSVPCTTTRTTRE